MVNIILIRHYFHMVFSILVILSFIGVNCYSYDVFQTEHSQWLGKSEINFIVLGSETLKKNDRTDYILKGKYGDRVVDLSVCRSCYDNNKDKVGQNITLDIQQIKLHEGVSVARKYIVRCFLYLTIGSIMFILYMSIVDYYIIIKNISWISIVVLVNLCLFFINVINNFHA